MQTGFWGRRQSAFLDIRVTYPELSLHHFSGGMNLRSHDRIKSVEFGSFTPLVFSTFGGFGREAVVFYSHLADLLARKHGTPYSKTLSLLHCSISFSLLHSIQGSRTVRCIEHPSTSAELHSPEAHIAFLFCLLFCFSFVQHLCHLWLARAKHPAWEKNFFDAYRIKAITLRAPLTYLLSEKKTLHC